MNTTLQYKLHSGKNSKAAYYMQAALRDMLPDRLYAMRLNRELERCAAMYDRDYIADRVDYYCKLSRPVTLGSDSEPIGALQRKGNPSTYYYDSREALQWFNPELRWHYLFGDIRDIPAEPTVVKSRALGTDNSNSVLLKLDRCRHFVYINDHLQPEEKEDRAIFRGHIGTRENRALFCRMYADNPRVDAADTLPGATEGHKHTSQMKPMMSFYEHLRFRYIMALEGNDVASNLKWIMSSRSAAVMPKPTCETWFMEGRLVGGVHYVEIRPDFSDLEEKMDHYSNHLDELRTIVDNANQYVAQFRDTRRERYIALLVMQKYFKMTNQ
ncbi:MAG: lipopolysaccharide biosynthesis protein [Bacteroidales bacterium]|nr:lipopolysaccharide biosynthesis protein [Bacteroidales bacterium]